MNEHVKNNQGHVVPVRPVDKQPIRSDAVYFQDDADYPVDPLDLPDYRPAPGKGATENRQGVDENR